jgi:hypothetical protein
MIKTVFMAVAAAILCGGCAGASRARGRVEVGHTPQQVEDALGKPDRVYRRQTSSGDLETWGYMPYWPGFSTATEPIGSRGSLSQEIPLEPIRDDEDLRVFFKAGKVVAVESRKSK